MCGTLLAVLSMASKHLMGTCSMFYVQHIYCRVDTDMLHYDVCLSLFDLLSMHLVVCV